jgi:hypothetical protein
VCAVLRVPLCFDKQESYLGWLRTTGTRFKKLIIDVYWTMDQAYAVNSGHVDANNLLQDWGLLYLGWDTILDHTLTYPRTNLPCDEPTQQFIYALFDHLGHTDSIDITFDLHLYNLGAPGTLRKIHSNRSNEDPNRIDLCHEVAPSLVDLAVQVVELVDDELREYRSDPDMSDDISL